MKGKLYVHVQDETRFILVQIDSQFPSEHFDLNEWRLVDVAVKAPDQAAGDALRENGHYEFRK